VAISAVFLARRPPVYVLGAAAGPGTPVPAVALPSGSGLVPASWKRVSRTRTQLVRQIAYVLAGEGAAATIRRYLVMVLLACGTVEITIGREAG